MVLTAIAATSDVDPVSLSLINWVEKQIEALRANYQLMRDYYEGRHASLLTRRMRKYLPQKLTFRDNFCDIVVDSMAEQLRVTGFEVEEGASEEIGAWLWKLWKTARMDRVQGVTHTETLMLGDGYILVDYDNDLGRPRFFYQEPEMMIPHYDASTGEMLWISKKWKVEAEEMGVESDTHRMNVYYPDRIEKFISDRRIWKEVRDETDADWPVPWLDKAGAPLGIPVTHFRNMSLSNDYGRSELSNAVPLQDMINKSLVDYAQVADTMGFPQRYLLNISAEVTKLDLVPGAIWDLQSEAEGNQLIGQFPTAPLEQLLKGMDMLVDHFSAVTRTPKHLLKLTGNYPSGEALKVAEAGLVSKIEDRHADFGNSWEDVMRMALKLEGAFGTQAGAGDEDELVLNTLWKDPETRNEESHLAALVSKRELGVSQEQIWREMGYDETQIAKMLDEQEGERVRSANLGGLVLEQFARGQDGGGQGGGP